jgi:hypothetical protein
VRHFHGTPIGGPLADVPRFLNRRDALVPFSSPRDLPIALNVCRAVVLDNGAFTVWKQGGQLDVNGYVEWVRSAAGHPRLEYAFIPDVIEGTEAQNDALIDLWPHDLYRYGCPVWHMHESLYRLRRLAMEWPFVALGSSGDVGQPGTQKWWRRLGMAMGELCDDSGRPRVKIHGLRMLDPEIVRRVPFYGADSTNAAQNGQRYGERHGLNPSQGREVLAMRIEQAQSADRWEPVRTVDYYDLFAELGA